jgi:hypothetical protein
MNQDRPYPGDLGSFPCSQNRVLEERLSHPLSFKGHIHSETPDYHDRYGIRRIAPDPTCNARMLYTARGKSVIARDPAALANDICARCAAFLVGERPAPEPIIQKLFSTLKLRYIVCGFETLRRGDVWSCLSHGAFVLIRRASPGLLGGGLSSMSMNRLKSVSFIWK